MIPPSESKQTPASESRTFDEMHSRAQTKTDQIFEDWLNLYLTNSPNDFFITFIKSLGLGPEAVN